LFLAAALAVAVAAVATGPASAATGGNSANADACQHGGHETLAQLCPATATLSDNIFSRQHRRYARASGFHRWCLAADSRHLSLDRRSRGCRMVVVAFPT
jgi:hypothetical protein